MIASSTSVARLPALAILLGLTAFSGVGRGENAVEERTTYYVSARTGDNDNPGTQSAPLRTIGAAVARMKAGDTCTIREGVYRETVRPGDGQRFRAFPGERVVVSGCEVVEGWSPARGSVRTARVDSRVLQLFLGGARMEKARYPNEDGDLFDTSDWAETIASRGRPNGARVTFTDGLGGKNFDGGFFTGMNGKNPFQTNMGRIVKTDGDTLVCDRTNLRWYRSRPGQFDGPGRGYIIDHLNALTDEREWHWEKGVLHFIPPVDESLETNRVEARVRIWGFDVTGRQDVVIEGLVFHAASVLMRDATGCSIDRCEFAYVSPWGRHFDVRANGDPEHYTYGDPADGTSGIHIGGSRNGIRNCRIAYGWGALVTLRGHHNTVENNIIENAGWQGREFAVNVVVNGAEHRVVRNTLRTSAAMLIVMIDIDRIPTTGTIVQYNDCRDYGRIMLDGGTAAIYQNGNNDLGGSEFSHNLIADNRTSNQRVSTGIYLDDGANNARIHHNVIVGTGLTRSGVFTHKGNRRLEVYKNTFWGQKQSAWVSAVWKGASRDAATMIFRDNLCGGRGFSPSGVHDAITVKSNRENAAASLFRNVAKLDFRLLDPSAAPGVGAYADGDWAAGATLRESARAAQSVLDD